MLVLAVLVFSLWREITLSSQYQRHVRQAVLARSHLLRVQIDMESGLRGYTSTGDKSFLQPYFTGLHEYASAAAELQRAVELLGNKADLLRARGAIQQQLHEEWLSSVAGPLLASPHRADALQKQLHGKALIDRFRSENYAMYSELNSIADASDRALTETTRQLLILGAIFELALLGLALATFMADRRAVLERARAVAVEEELEEERRAADLLQRAFLQNVLPSLPEFALHGSYTPAEVKAQIGGDWYDAIALPDGRFFFSIGDVTGHGLEAAVTMSRVRQSLISSAVYQSDPGCILASANETLLLQDERVVTAICGFVDVNTLEIRYATAGHPPPVLAHPGRDPHFLPYDGLPLGVEPGTSYRTFVANGAPGTLFVLYTDGLLEHKRDILVGQARVLSAAARAAETPQNDPTALIEEAVFGGERNAADDVAILALRFQQRAYARMNGDDARESSSAN